jgi:hypothetical protein
MTSPAFVDLARFGDYGIQLPGALALVLGDLRRYLTSTRHPMTAWRLMRAAPTFSSRAAYSATERVR